MNQTIFCNLDEAFDYAAAFLDGGMPALRDAIQRERLEAMDEQQTQYDDSNQIALWPYTGPNDNPVKGIYTGGGKKADMDGAQVRSAVLVQRERRTDRGPIADLYWYTDDMAFACPIFRQDDGKLSGKVDGWWVNVWPNDRDRGPKYRVKFRVREAVASGNSSKPVDADELPF